MRLKFLSKQFPVIAFFLMLVIALPGKVHAGYSPQCSGGIVVEKVSFEDSYQQGAGTISIKASGLANGESYFLGIFRSNMLNVETARIAAGQNQTYNGSEITLSVDIPQVAMDRNDAKVLLMRDRIALPNAQVCQLGTIDISRDVDLTCSARVTQDRTINGSTKTCDIRQDPTHCVERGNPLKVDIDIDGENSANQSFKIDITDNWCVWFDCHQNVTTDANGQASYSFNTSDFPGGNGEFHVSISKDTWGLDYLECVDMSFDLYEGECKDSEDEPICAADGGLDPIEPDEDFVPPVYELCSQITNPAMKEKCENCAGGSTGRDGVWTAVGCIKRDPESIITRLIQIGLGMGGGVSLLMTLAGGFILSTSQGDPQRTSQAKEMITSAVIGLLFVIFSVVILQFIGVTVLQIPGFGS